MEIFCLAKRRCSRKVWTKMAFRFLLESHGFLRMWNAPGNWYRSHFTGLMVFHPEKPTIYGGQNDLKVSGLQRSTVRPCLPPDVWPQKKSLQWVSWMFLRIFGKAKKNCKNLQELTLYSFQLGNFSWRIFMISPHQRVAETFEVHSSFACFA